MNNESLPWVCFPNSQMPLPPPICHPLFSPMWGHAYGTENGNEVERWNIHKIKSWVDGPAWPWHSLQGRSRHFPAGCILPTMCENRPSQTVITNRDEYENMLHFIPEGLPQRKPPHPCTCPPCTASLPPRRAPDRYRCRPPPLPWFWKLKISIATMPLRYVLCAMR